MELVALHNAPVSAAETAAVRPRRQRRERRGHKPGSLGGACRGSAVPPAEGAQPPDRPTSGLGLRGASSEGISLRAEDTRWGLPVTAAAGAKTFGFLRVYVGSARVLPCTTGHEINMKSLIDRGHRSASIVFLFILPCVLPRRWLHADKCSTGFFPKRSDIYAYVTL